MLSTKEIFQKIFSEENIEHELSGFLKLNKKERNIALGGFPFRINWEFQPVRECQVVMGKNHILIDARKVQAINIKLFLSVLVPLGIILIFLYTIISKNLLFPFASLILAWPLPFIVIFAWITSVKGGATSYLLKREWIDKMQFSPDFLIEGRVPAGQPYVLSQYLAKNNIKIPGLLSGKAAWLGTDYPWPFVEVDFKMKVSSEYKQKRLATYIILILASLLLWASIHSTYLVTETFRKGINF